MKPTNETGVTDSPEDIARGSLQQHGWTAPYDIPADVAKKIIAAKDALTNMTGTDAIQEAYHQLYAIADPEFKSINPWSILEAQSNEKSSESGGRTPANSQNENR
jgi:hypothetical protein